jgi:hypothetical protein
MISFLFILQKRVKSPLDFKALTNIILFRVEQKKTPTRPKPSGGSGRLCLAAMLISLPRRSTSKQAE